MSVRTMCYFCGVNPLVPRERLNATFLECSVCDAPGKAGVPLPADSHPDKYPSGGRGNPEVIQ